MEGFFMGKILILLVWLFSPMVWGLGVMSYNVENFFDASKSEKTDDSTYLPLKSPYKKECKKIRKSYYRKYCEKLDWTQEKVDLKLKQHLKVLSSFPKKIHLLSLVEIENENLVKAFAKNLPLKGYVITTGSDRRGINTALLFDKEVFKFVDHKEWSLSFKTRNLLEVHLETKDKKPFVVFVNHWPSQRSKTPKRLEAANLLKKRMKEILKEKPKTMIVALGDFNTLDNEYPHPFDGIKEDLKDSSVGSKEGGSYFYKPAMSWNLLDRIFYSSNLTLKKFEVYRPEFTQTVTEYTKKGPFWGSRITGIPKGFDHKKKNKPGYSDHFPVYADFSGTFNDK
jgi:endonuclease/exonuclease/phosphatase family metal-dependent hydrolase